MATPLWPPVAGFYRIRLVRGGPLCAAMLWQGFGFDPDGGEPRGMWTWRAMVNCAEVHLDRVWPYCADKGCTEAEYDYLLAVHGHAKRWTPDMPEAKPREKVDLHRTPALF